MGTVWRERKKLVRKAITGERSCRKEGRAHGTECVWH